MHQPVTHANDSRPRNMGVLFTRLRRDFAGGFAHDLDRMHQGEDEHVVLVQVRASASRDEPGDRA